MAPEFDSSPLKNEAWIPPTLQETIIYLTIREKEIIFKIAISEDTLL